MQIEMFIHVRKPMFPFISVLVLARLVQYTQKKVSDTISAKYFRSSKYGRGQKMLNIYA